MSLPKDFLDKMQELLQDEYDLFIKSYEQEKSLGLRLNLLKTDKDHFIKINHMHLTPIPWVLEGFFISKLIVQESIRIMKREFIIFRNRAP